MTRSIARESLGVVAIAKDEERDLPGFLSHILAWVDEIVIVDDGSCDGTREIAAAAGPKVKVVERALDEHSGFAGLRNAGIDASSSEWLLHMDIDERVTPALAREIRNAIRDSKNDGFRYRRLNFYFHRPMRAGGLDRWNEVHLARRDFRFEGVVHEHLVVPKMKDIGQLRNVMWHLNDEAWEERLRKSLLYSCLEGRRLADRGGKLGVIQIMARPLWQFFRVFVLHRGFRDGVPGLIVAIHGASAVFQWQALAWDRLNALPRASLEQQIRDAYSKEASESQAAPMHPAPKNIEE